MNQRHHRPVVKFRNIDRATLDCLEGLVDENSEDEVQHTDASDSNERDLTLLESLDDDEEDWEFLLDGSTSEVVAFCIDPYINLDSSTLLDMVSNEPLVTAKLDNQMKTWHEPDSVTCSDNTGKPLLNW